MIHIEGDWYILVDESCYVLQRNGENKGFYSTLYKAVQGYVKYLTIETLSDKEISLTEALNLLQMRMRDTHEKLAELKEILHE